VSDAHRIFQGGHWQRRSCLFPSSPVPRCCSLPVAVGCLFACCCLVSSSLVRFALGCLCTGRLRQGTVSGLPVPGLVRVHAAPHTPLPLSPFIAMRAALALFAVLALYVHIHIHTRPAPLCLCALHLAASQTAGCGRGRGACRAARAERSERTECDGTTSVGNAAHPLSHEHVLRDRERAGGRKGYFGSVQTRTSSLQNPNRKAALTCALCV
jgi:hypothetical protein